MLRTPSLKRAHAATIDSADNANRELIFYYLAHGHNPPKPCASRASKSPSVTISARWTRMLGHSTRMGNTRRRKSRVRSTLSRRCPGSDDAFITLERSPKIE